VVGEGDGEGVGELDGGLGGGPVTLVWVVKVDVKNIVPEVLVAVLSLGTVMTSVTAAEVSKVMGTKTVALVVGGSRVSVIV
jgi:hypothetical protein